MRAGARGGAGRHRAGAEPTLGGVTQARPCGPRGGSRMDGENVGGHEEILTYFPFTSRKQSKINNLIDSSRVDESYTVHVRI